MWDRVRGGTGRKLTPSLILSPPAWSQKNISPPPAFHPQIFLLDSPLAGSPKKDLRPRCARNNKVGEEYLIWEQIDIDTAVFLFPMNSTFVKIKLVQNIDLNLIT